MHECMDWRTVRFDWNRARAFLVTAEEGSLSAAARALGASQPTIGRQVEALEQDLGVLLFDRIANRLSLTPSGVELLEHVRAMGDAASRVTLAASGQSQTLEGTVTVTATDMFSAYLLPPMLAKLRRLEPGIVIEIVATNTRADLRRREADIAIRNFPPEHPDLIAKKVRNMNGNLFAATAYLEALGRPKTPAGFSDADFIGLDGTSALIDVLANVGFSLTTRNFPFVTENLLVAWSLVRHGLGIGINAEPIADPDPLVERIIADLEPIEFPVWLISHRELHTSRRVRRVFDLLAEELAAI